MKFDEITNTKLLSIYYRNKGICRVCGQYPEINDSWGLVVVNGRIPESNNFYNYGNFFVHEHCFGKTIEDEDERIREILCKPRPRCKNKIKENENVKLPTGTSEIIINTESIETKKDYCEHAYDDNLVLKTCSDISIIDYMFC